MLTHEELLRLVHYDAATGIMSRKVRTSNRVHLGDQVGTINKHGYRQTAIGGKRGFVHQFAWFYMTGVWPSHDIDHKDRNKINNRFSNLRKATESQNLANTCAHKDSFTGIKGVHRKRHRWCAQIMCCGERLTLGSFATKEEARFAYNSAARKLFGEFARAA